jgi:pimeloyl-ACP methyl ester carboxylesterase
VLDTKRLLCACLMVAASFGASAAGAAVHDCPEPVGPGYFPSEDTSRAAAIVFLHGLDGDWRTTWEWRPGLLKRLGGAAPVFWPCLLLPEKGSDPSLARTNIYLHQYRADLLEKAPSIAQLADDLFSQLERANVFRHESVSFVAHSMGGLVLAKMLDSRQDRRQQLDRIRLIQFFGTPGEGSDWASVAMKLLPNRQVEELLKGNSLEQLVARWKGLPHIRVSFCAAEDPPLLSPLIVTQESAGALCTSPVRILPGFDHVEMVKPSPSRLDPHQLFYDRYVRCVRQHLMPKSGAEVDAETRQFATDLFFTLRDRQTSIKELLFVHPTIKGRYAAPVQSGAYTNDWAREWLTANEFASVAREQLGPRLEGLRLERILMFANLPTLIADHQVLRLKRDLIETGLIGDDDIVISLRSPSPGGISRTLLIGNLQVGLDEVKPAMRLKGFLFTVDPGTCE